MLLRRDAGISLAKLTRPSLATVLPRERLFARLDETNATRAIWICAPPGAGKTTLLASYLDHRKLPCLWYQLDAGDGDVATFFYYLGLAGRQAAPRARSPLPLFTPEHSAGLPAFSRRFFRGLCGALKPSSLLVFDNYQDVPFMDDALLPGWAAVPLTLLVILGVTNAVNLADGLDGLAGGLALMSFAGIAYLAYQLTSRSWCC